MKPYDYYHMANVPSPTRAQYEMIYAYDAGALVFHGPRDKYTEIRSSLPFNHVKQIEFDEDGFLDARKRFNAERSQLLAEFQEAIIADIVSDVKIENKVLKSAYKMAWEEGHGEGLEAVHFKFQDLISVITGEY